MERLPETELMEDEEQAKAYALADFSISHTMFVDLFIEKFSNIPSSFNDVILDLGCGPCDITRRFAKAYPDASFHAVDGAAAMLKQAKILNDEKGFSHKIKLVEAVIQELESPQPFYHLIISNSLLHHLKNPFDLWASIKKHAKPYAHVFIMDLMRPIDEHTVKFLSNEYAKNEPEILKKDFESSLRAAYTVKEVRLQLEKEELTKLQVEEISDRHMIIYGVI